MIVNNFIDFFKFYLNSKIKDSIKICVIRVITGSFNFPQYHLGFF